MDSASLITGSSPADESLAQEPQQHQEPKEGPPTDLIFLNFTKPNEHKDTQNKKIIRSNAMLHYKRRKLRNRNRPKTDTRGGKSVARNRKPSRNRKSSSIVPQRKHGNERLETFSRNDQIMLLDQSLHNRGVNPPNGLPTSAPIYAPMFLHYYYLQFHYYAKPQHSYRTQPSVKILLNPNIEDSTSGNASNPMRAALIGEALNQQMYFEAVMYMVSTHLDVLRGTGSSMTTLVHRGKSLKLINECLQEQRTNPSDLLIATIFGFVNYENVSGHLTESTTHMAGVHTMVMLRGGLQHLGMNGVLAKMIVLSDIMRLALGTSKSIFQLSEIWTGDSNRDSIGILPVRRTVSRQSTASTRAPSVDEKLMALLNLLREVNMQFATINIGQGLEESITAFFNASSRLQRKLQYLANDITDRDRRHPKYHQYECCRLAAHIYVESIFSPLTFSAPRNESHLKQLAAALQQANCPNDWNPIPEALIWVCLVGGAAAKGRRERGWMVAHLGPALMSLGMFHFEDLITSMLLFVRLSRVSSQFWNSA